MTRTNCQTLLIIFMSCVGGETASFSLEKHPFLLEKHPFSIRKTPIFCRDSFVFKLGNISKSLTNCGFEGVMSTFYIDECTPHALTMVLELFCSKLGHIKASSMTQADIIISWNDRYYSIISRANGEVVSPAWVLGSTICECTLPTEEYSLDHKNFLSGLAISISDVAAQLSSYCHAYITLISCYGGRISQPGSSLCTHILRRDKVMDLSLYEQLPKSKLDLLYMYNFIVDNARSSEPSSIRAAFDDTSLMSTVRCHPIVVPEQWLIDSILQRSRSDECHPQYRAHLSANISLSLTTLCSQLCAQHTPHVTSHLPDKVTMQYTAQEELLKRQLDVLRRSASGTSCLRIPHILTIDNETSDYIVLSVYEYIQIWDVFRVVWSIHRTSPPFLREHYQVAPPPSAPACTSM